MSVITKIKTLTSTLTANEKLIADFVVANPEQVKELPSQRLAEQVGVSQSSIVKFTQKLGLKGYSALRFALAESLTNNKPTEPLLGEITLKDDVQSLTQKLLASKINVLTETANINNNETFEQAVEIIKKAKRIMVCGIGASGLVAQDFCHKLQKVGLAATAETSGHLQLSYAATFGQQDLVVCISESGATSDVVAVAELAASNRASVISITGINKSKLQKLANVKLYTVAETDSVRLSSIVSRTSQEYIIDALFLLLTQGSASFREQVERSNLAVSQFIKHSRQS